MNNEQVRAAALEEAAKICDSVNNHDNPMTAGDCADAIRALASSAAPGRCLGATKLDQQCVCPTCGTERSGKLADDMITLPIDLIASACYVIRKTGEHDSLLAKLRAYTTGEFSRPADSSSAAPSDELAVALRKAFITLESNGKNAGGRNLVLKFNQREDSYVVHDFLLKSLAAPSPTRESLSAHARNCSGYDPMQECTCGVAFKQQIASLQSALGTEKSMHAAWRKRAEEAEAAPLATPRQTEDGSGLSAEPVAKVIEGGQIRFLANGKNFPKAGTLLFASTSTPKQPASAVQGGVPEGWTIGRKEGRERLTVQKDGLGYAPHPDDESIASVVLWHLANDILAAAPGAAK